VLPAPSPSRRKLEVKPARDDKGKHKEEKDDEDTKL
jgi:hypothetical protein